MAPTDESAGGRLSYRAFGERLSALKRRGSALLVVGVVPDDHRVRLCRRMLGDSTEECRRRLVVQPETATPSPDDRLPPSAGGESLESITFTIEKRSSAARPTPSEAVDRPTLVDGTDLTELGIAISEVIAAFEERGGDLDPAELRVCLDSFQTLLGEHDERDVFRFLHVLVGRIKSVRGMGHVHLSARPDDELVDVFAPLFDAVIEVRTNGGRLEQRWQFPKDDRVSAWIPL